MDPAILIRFPFRSLAALGRIVSLAALLLLNIPAAMAQEIVVEHPVSTNILNNGSVLYGSSPVETPVTKTYTIRNASLLPLENIAVVITGTDTDEFIVASQPASALIGNGNTTFSVRFVPSSPGPKTAKIRISSTDQNENPFFINISGFATQPDISVSQSTTPLVDGASTVNFGTVIVGQQTQRTFTIRNEGNAPLTNLLLINGVGPFTPGALPARTLAPGAGTTFTVTFTPESAGAVSGSIAINSNDPDSTPFEINLTGTGALPWLEVEQPPGTPLISGFSQVEFGTTPAGEPVTLTFTIRNVGAAALTGLALSPSGAHAADFNPETLTTTTLATGGTLTFNVTFAPAAEGVRTATLEILSNETAGNTFAVFLTGTASGTPDAGDIDKDGTPNLVEYATGLDPQTPNPPPGTLAKNGENLEFTLTRLKSALPEVTFSVEWTETLTGPWTPVEGATFFLTSETETVQTGYYTVPAGSAGRRFVRLRVTRVPGG